MWGDLILKWSEVKWVTVKLLVTKVPCTLWWSYTEGTWLYCDYFIWCASCTVVVLTFLVMCECFGNMCTCIYCVLYCLYCVFVLFLLCIFNLICSVCTGVRTTATGWQLNWDDDDDDDDDNNNNNNNNNNVFKVPLPLQCMLYTYRLVTVE
jgi:hypothetical protein